MRLAAVRRRRRAGKSWLSKVFFFLSTAVLHFWASQPTTCQENCQETTKTIPVIFPTAATFNILPNCFEDGWTIKYFTLKISQKCFVCGEFESRKIYFKKKNVFFFKQ